jgi:two-component system phosphate regulon sensor histidine kinase PhoR
MEARAGEGMSDTGPGETRPPARLYLAVVAGALAAILFVILYPSVAPAVAIAALLLFAVIGFFRAAPRRAPSGAAPVAPPSEAGIPAVAREVFEGLDDPLLVLDSVGRVVFANHAAHAIVGPDCERKRIAAVLRTPEVLEAVERVRQGGAPESVPFGFLVPVQRYYQAYIARTGAGVGAPLVLLHIRDLTAMRRAEELRADFVANASHELRTPLAAVSGFIDTLKGHAKDDPDARERFLDIMSVEAGRMRRLIDDLLSLTRIELNEHNPPSGTVDIVAVAHQAAAALAPLAAADGIAIKIAPHAPLRVMGERDELTQVLQNLIHNAIKYGRERGEVRVKFGDAGTQSGRDGHRQVFVAIEDEGEGIPREAIPRLTERFYRVDVKRSRERGGTGLGLAIVKHILNRHQGRLQIESEPRKGSTFTVVLPALPEAGEQAAAS